MSPLFVFLLITLTSANSSRNGSMCNGFPANFSLKGAIGSWYVVAIIPEKLFPDNQHVTCYRVDFSETDEAGLRWLVNNTHHGTPRPDLVNRIKGTIIRQRYHSERPFDVWSKSIDGVKGCFQQVLSLDKDQTDLNKAHTHDAMMQLHFLDTNDSSGPFLLQMLWGRLIGTVIYRRKQDVTEDELRPVFEFMSKLRGPQRTPRICEQPNDPLVLNQTK